MTIRDSFPQKQYIWARAHQLALIGAKFAAIEHDPFVEINFSMGRRKLLEILAVSCFA